MFSTKIKITILTFAAFISFPLFIYFNESNISLSNCIDRCIAIQPITFFFFLPIFLLIWKNNLILPLFIFVFLLLFDFFFYDSIIDLLVAIKSIVPFFFLTGFILIRKELKNNLNFTKFLINIFLPYCVIFFQIIIFFSEIIFLFQGLDMSEPLKNLFFLNINIYNYNQYFSFILVLVCGIRLFLISKKKEGFFLTILMLIAPIHAVNYVAFICSILIIIFKIIFLINSKSKKILNILKLFSYIFASTIVIIPLFSFIIPPTILEILNESGFTNLTIRFIKYNFIFENLKLENLLYGSYPNSFFSTQSHSQFLEYILYFGFLKATFLIFIILFMILKITRIEYLLPVCVIIGLGGAFNELLSHWYNSQIILLYICLSSLIKINKK
jgi:hypothetical protein